jgi:serine/threonine-protein kinase
LLAQQIDQVCDHFEAAWKAGQRPRIEDYLADTPEPGQALLLCELVALEIAYRRRLGEEPRPEEYHARFRTLEPGWLAQVVADSDSIKVEGPIRIKADAAKIEVLCPACGNAFRVQDSQPTDTLSPMRRLGKFQLLERVGVGACGAVWRARDTELDRIVALKIAHAGLLQSPTDRERFQREARAAAQLRHPGIVPVHEVVLLEGLPALVTDFIQGVPLRDLLQVRRLAFRKAAALVAEVAEALDYAHARGLVHRDIKPANIMLESAARAGLVHCRDPGRAAAWSTRCSSSRPAGTAV